MPLAVEEAVTDLAAEFAVSLDKNELAVLSPAYDLVSYVLSFRPAVSLPSPSTPAQNHLEVLYQREYNGVYSSYEHSVTHSTPSSTSESLYILPTDIVLETLFSTTLLCVGIVLGSPSLRPIEWNKWAKEVTLDDRRPPGKRKFERQGDGTTVGNPFRFLEDGERRGFADVMGQRKEFAKWVREGSKAEAS
ncbi:uncharacterized protein PV09_02416 [Verruconis gallopava]|uniref:Uncharacterized protein n=1 Tax=Verruconis gallopava TaxID=253628 RepID=A0A0D1Z187_9PEZI|nr:uncharacterized protein PV09_02416 [Verruconis gallopava]KIW06722.1 hypothetical protein PV09_02416 [Verruconis gallopava]